MTSSVTYSSPDYSSAMDAVRIEVEEYCSANNIDPEDYLASLDSNLSLSVFDNAVLEPYFQLAYMQLMEILHPEVINSLSAEIGGPVNFETLHANTDQDMTDLIKSLIEDDPELMGYFARQQGGEIASEEFFGILEQEVASVSADGGGPTDDARALMEHYDLGEGFEWVINKEDGFKAAEMSILDKLSDIDAYYSSILNDPNMSESQKQSLSQENMFQKEVYLGMLQSITTAESTFFEMISKIYQQANQTSMSVINNWKV